MTPFYWTNDFDKAISDTFLISHHLGVWLKESHLFRDLLLKDNITFFNNCNSGFKLTLISSWHCPDQPPNPETHACNKHIQEQHNECIFQMLYHTWYCIQVTILGIFSGMGCQWCFLSFVGLLFWLTTRYLILLISYH